MSRYADTTTDKMRSSRKKKTISAVWALTVILSAVLIFAGNRIVSSRISVLDNNETAAKAKVTELGELVEESLDGIHFSARTQYFKARLMSGPEKGKLVQAYQQIDSYTDIGDRFVQVGDRVVLYNYGYMYDTDDWVFGNYIRFSYVVVLGLLFLVLLLLFGRIKGLNTIISLAYTCLARIHSGSPCRLQRLSTYGPDMRFHHHHDAYPYQRDFR